jgi:Flp pilus assembly protein TadD
LSVEESQRLVGHQTDSLEAHVAYMKGSFFWNKRTPADIKRSIDYFSNAVRIDPDYAAAHVGLARAKMSLFALNLTPPDEFPEIEAIVDRALRLDHQNPETHSIKAQLRLYTDRDWAGAEKEHRAAISVGQHCALSYDNYSIFLSLLGRFEEALTLNQSARVLEPTSLVLSASRCRSLFLAREYERSVTELEDALELSADGPIAYFLLGLNYDQLGEHKKAQAAYDQYIRLYGDNPEVLTSLCRSSALSGDYARAQRLLGRVLALSRRKRVSNYYIANAHLGLGEVEKCLSAREKAF